MNVFFRRATPLGVTLGLSVVCLIAASLLPGLVATTNAAPAPPQAALTTEQAAFFEKNIRPVLANNCYGCHSADSKAAGGLLVDSRETLLKGGRSGPAIIPGDPDDSLLLKRIHLSDEKHRMPKDDDPLQKSDVDNLTTWIKEGAFWPSNSGSTSSAGISLPPQVAAASVSLTPTSEQLAYFKKMFDLFS
jgi:mono/diheme cytochrome c family protein